MDRLPATFEVNNAQARVRQADGIIRVESEAVRATVPELAYHYRKLRLGRSRAERMIQYACNAAHRRYPERLLLSDAIRRIAFHVRLFPQRISDAL